MKKTKDIKKSKRVRIHRKVRTRVSGTAKTPRLSVFRSNRYIYAQLINDETARTIAGVSDLKMKGKNKIEKASKVGLMIAVAGKGEGVSRVVFDRGGFAYRGRIKAVAEAAREGGLRF